MTSAIQNEDRLSDLPEELLSNILSLMPANDAVETCILSKRWRYSWTMIHNFDFGRMYNWYDAHRLSRFVEGVLVHCKTPEINLFRLHDPQNLVKRSSVLKWINEAVRLNIREVDISADYVNLPSCLLISKTLTKLKLDCGGYLEHPVNLPCLKTLDLATNYRFASALKLVRGCQILESLSLKVYRFDNNEDFILDIPTLKILKLTLPGNNSVKHNIVLKVPNLEYLSVGGKLCSQFVTVDLSLLVKASFSFTNVISAHLWAKLLKGISGVKSLSSSCSSSANHALFSLSLPTFPNLKHLDLKNFPEKTPISQILKRSPELEHLNIEVLKGFCWIRSVPGCKLMNLKTIRFTKVTLRKYDMRFLKYMLEKAKGLKTLTITGSKMCRKDEKQLWNQLAKFRRASTYCEIRCFGCHFSYTII